MAENTFYVGAAKNGKEFAGYVPARFLTVNGQPVVDPAPLGSQHGFFYSDDRGSAKTNGIYANPNNYLVVPADFNEEYARQYAAKINHLQAIPVIGSALAKLRLVEDFRPSGSEELQRGMQWGIPADSAVQPFVNGASHYLGFINGLTGIPVKSSEAAGGITNGGHDKSGPGGVPGKIM